MSNQETFISRIAPLVVKWRDTFGFGVASAIIAQACLESAYGTSSKAGHHNYYGLKFKPNRVSCHCGTFKESSQEQRPDGSYYGIVTEWYEFANMDRGCEGYFQFIQTGGYVNARVQTTPRGYLQALKDSGYATSLKYVDNVMAVVYKYDLTKYDGGGIMYSNSPLVNYVDLTPNNYGARTHKIDTITIHHMAGNLSVKTCGELFHRKRGSSNYGINGKDIAMYVPESTAAMTSSNQPNDERAITIECANDMLAPYWTISADTMNSLIFLCADICLRNDIPALVWSDNKTDRIKHKNGCNMTLHKDFSATACPGPFLSGPGMMQAIANAVNAILASNAPIPTNGYIINGYDYSPVFDPVFYANKYADIKAAFGNDANALWLHFQQFGMNEFRQASAQFDPVFYKNKYPDVERAFGDDRPMYYWHYIAFGISEGRQGAE
jgi:hypothetical protein